MEHENPDPSPTDESSIDDAPPAKEKPAVWKWIARRVMMFAVVLYVAWIVALVLLQERVIFPGWHSRTVDARLHSPTGCESLWRDIGDGQRVEAWFLPGMGCTVEHLGPLVVFCHGNAELIDDNGWALTRYREMGVSVLLPEYRGFGRSGGTPSERGLTEDAVAFYDMAMARPEVDPKRVIFHGRSIGGGVVCQLAAQRPPAAMVLESTFTSMAAMTWRYGAPSFLLRHPFRSDRVIERLNVPMLIMHGTHDEVIPVSHGRKLARIATDATYLEFDAGHNDFPPDEDAYWEAIRTLLRTHGLID